jgi:hypothetical protein
MGIAIFVAPIVVFVYISLLWHLPSVVSMLEDLYEIKSMICKALIKGKMGLVVALFFTLTILLI